MKQNQPAGGTLTATGRWCGSSSIVAQMACRVRKTVATFALVFLAATTSQPANPSAILLTSDPGTQSPAFVGCAVVALARDPAVPSWNGQSVPSGQQGPQLFNGARV